MTHSHHHAALVTLPLPHVQDGSLRIYLCTMLKQAPLVTEALAVALGGDKFFTAYVPLLGMEVRVQVGGGGQAMARRGPVHIVYGCCCVLKGPCSELNLCWAWRCWCWWVAGLRAGHRPW